MIVSIICHNKESYMFKKISFLNTFYIFFAYFASKQYHVNKVCPLVSKIVFILEYILVSTMLIKVLTPLPFFFWLKDNLYLTF